MNEDSYLDKNGFLKLEEFINEKINNLIYTDVKKVFNGKANIPNGFNIIKKNNRRYKKNIIFPFLIDSSINFLELAIDVFEVLKKNSKKVSDNYLDYRLTNFDIEEVKDKSLFMHTDNNSGMFRCFIFLNGADKLSGASKYIRGSHRRDFFVKHKLTDAIIRENNYEEEIITANNGDMIILNTFGFHGNTIQKKARLTLIFEFRDIKQNQPSNINPISAVKISDKVLNHLYLFKVNQNKKHGGYIRQNNLPTHINPLNLIKPAIRFILSYFRY